MEGLKELDPVAYVRFASVYRNFREEKDFVQFVDKIDVFKKDNFKLSNRKLMKLAIRLASNQKYLTGINPSVGCVITNNNKFLSYGVTGFKGKTHTQKFLQLKIKKFNLKNSKMLVTLEPCTHYGKTILPCTNSIIKSKIKNVIFSHTDEDLRTKNKATKILNDKKINDKKTF